MSSVTDKPKNDPELGSGEEEYLTVEIPDGERELGTTEIEKIPEVPPKDQIKTTLSEKQEYTRGRFSLIFIIGYFAILVMASIVSLLSEGNKSDNLKETLLTVSGILSIPLGFVIGYYFKKGKE